MLVYPLDGVVPVSQAPGQAADQQIVIVRHETRLALPDDGSSYVTPTHVCIPTYPAYLEPTYPPTYRERRLRTLPTFLPTLRVPLPTLRTLNGWSYLTPK